MTIQTLGIGKTAYPDLSYAPAPDRALDKLDASNIAKRLVVFTPGGDGVGELVENAARMGHRLLDGLHALQAEFECIGDVRGLGLMAAIEFTSDRATKAPANLGEKVRLACVERGLFTRAMGDNFMFSPPMIINAEEVDLMLQILGESIAAVQAAS